MKLLSKTEATSLIRKDNEELLEANLRLRKINKNALATHNSIKTDYLKTRSDEQKEFDLFCEDIKRKKSKLLKELNDLEQEISRKKDIYYGLIEKQDALEERIFEINERESKLELREGFVHQLEKKHGLL